MFDRTLTSNGAQSYNNEAVFTFEEKDYHTITIKAPASGYAFLEKLEFISEDSGILIEDGTLGGAGINDYYVANATIGTGNLAPVAISSQNGINSFFDRQGETKADLIICQHYTNDSLETLTTGINDAVSLTKSNNTPLVLVSEQPALNFVTAEGVLTEERESMAQLLRNAANNAHVSLIDWIKMVDFSVRNEYEARYFPGADKTHPSQEGAAIPLPSLLDLFSIPSPGHQSIYRSAKDLIKPASGKSPDFSEGYDKSSADKGVVLTNNNVGRKEGRVIIGAAVNGVTNQLAPLTFSLNAVNQVIGGDSNAEIQSNPDGADQFGAYKNDAVTKFVFGHRYLSKETVCSVVLLVRKINEALPGISFTSPTNNHVPRLYVNDSLVSGNQWLFSDYQVEDNEPYFVYGHLRLNTSSSPEKYIQINCSNLAVYGIWCVNGKAPTLSGKELERTRRISTPLLMVGDLTPAQAHNGQIYFEDIDSVTVEKEAVDSSVIKPRNGSDYYNLFKCLNKSVIDFHYIRPTSVENTSYDNFAGGYTSTISAGGDFRVTLSGFTAWEKTYTVFIPVSFVETYVSIQIYMFNPGNNTYVYLNNDLSWSLAPANPDEVIECSGENTAITFNMPDEATFSALGSNPQFRIAVVGNAKVATATLCQGSSACI